ncbi:hypothetical protein RDWZM_005762, partial [Blomia tropicalis]
ASHHHIHCSLVYDLVGFGANIDVLTHPIRIDTIRYDSLQSNTMVICVVNGNKALNNLHPCPRIESMSTLNL